MSAEDMDMAGTRTPLVVALSEAAILDPSLLGAKATNLGRLASAGFPVPPGYDLTVVKSLDELNTLLGI